MLGLVPLPVFIVPRSEVAPRHQELFLLQPSQFIDVDICDAHVTVLPQLHHLLQGFYHAEGGHPRHFFWTCDLVQL